MQDHDLGPTGTGAVIADIGGDRGALVLYAPESMVGSEIEIGPTDGDVKTHVAVRERRVGQNRLFAAFYPSVGAGEYVVWNLNSHPAGMVTIVGGEVAELWISVPANSRDPRGFTTSHRAGTAERGLRGL